LRSVEGESGLAGRVRDPLAINHAPLCMMFM
jgi:hypothetical protein